jgi:hypothetical protein
MTQTHRYAHSGYRKPLSATFSLRFIGMDRCSTCVLFCGTGGLKSRQICLTEVLVATTDLNRHRRWPQSILSAESCD